MMPPNRIPVVGERVIPTGSECVYQISRVNPEGTQVDLHREGTTIGRFRVPVADLKCVEKAPQPSRAATRSARKTINVEEVRERLATVQHSNMGLYAQTAENSVTSDRARQ
jgi:hypothetical protein